MPFVLSQGIRGALPSLAADAEQLLRAGRVRPANHLRQAAPVFRGGQQGLDPVFEVHELRQKYSESRGAEREVRAVVRELRLESGLHRGVALHEPHSAVHAGVLRLRGADFVRQFAAAVQRRAEGVPGHVLQLSGQEQQTLRVSRGAYPHAGGQLSGGQGQERGLLLRRFSSRGREQVLQQGGRLRWATLHLLSEPKHVQNH